MLRNWRKFRAADIIAFVKDLICSSTVNKKSHLEHTTCFTNRLFVPVNIYPFLDSFAAQNSFLSDKLQSFTVFWKDCVFHMHGLSEVHQKLEKMWKKCFPDTFCIIRNIYPLFMNLNLIRKIEFHLLKRFLEYLYKVILSEPQTLEK